MDISEIGSFHLVHRCQSRPSHTLYDQFNSPSSRESAYATSLALAELVAPRLVALSEVPPLSLGRQDCMYPSQLGQRLAREIGAEGLKSWRLVMRLTWNDLTCSPDCCVRFWSKSVVRHEFCKWFATHETAFSSASSAAWPREFISRWFQSLGAKVGACLVALLIVVAVVGPLVAGFDPDEGDFVSVFIGGPMASMVHWLGTDALFRDVLARLCAGARLSLSIAVRSTLCRLLLAPLLALRRATWRAAHGRRLIQY